MEMAVCAAVATVFARSSSGIGGLIYLQLASNRRILIGIYSVCSSEPCSTIVFTLIYFFCKVYLRTVFNNNYPTRLTLMRTTEYRSTRNQYYFSNIKKHED